MRGGHRCARTARGCFSCVCPTAHALITVDGWDAHRDGREHDHQRGEDVAAQGMREGELATLRAPLRLRALGRHVCERRDDVNIAS